MWTVVLMTERQHQRNGGDSTLARKQMMLEIVIQEAA